jgi:hypothetical protein
MPVVMADGPPPSKDRTVLWRNLCMIGEDFIECVVEISETKTKFYISAFDCMTENYKVLVLF